MVEEEVVHVENIETGENAMTRTSLVCWVVSMEVQKVAEGVQGRAGPRAWEQTVLVGYYSRNAAVVEGRKTGVRFQTLLKRQNQS